jgi:hypothetical protein
LNRHQLKIVSGLLVLACCFILSCKQQAAAHVQQQDGKVNRIDLQFLEACQRGELAVVRQRLDEGADILAMTDYRNGFFAAIDSGSLELMRFLLKKEKKLAVMPDPYGVKPLGYIIRGNGNFVSGAEPAERLALLDLLMAAGADMEETDCYGHGLSVIFFANGRFAPVMVEALLLRGAQVNRKSLAAYADSFCDNDFTLPAGSTPLDKYQALLGIVPEDSDFKPFKESIVGIIDVLKKHGARNGAWAVQQKSRKTT